MSPVLKRNTLTLWKVSLWYAVIGLFLTLILLPFPLLREYPLSADRVVPIPLVVMVVPLIATVWAVAGLGANAFDRRPLWCLISLGISAAALGLAGYVYFFQPGGVPGI